MDHLDSRISIVYKLPLNEIMHVRKRDNFYFAGIL